MNISDAVCDIYRIRFAMHRGVNLEASSHVSDRLPLLFLSSLA